MKTWKLNETESSVLPSSLLLLGYSLHVVSLTSYFGVWTFDPNQTLFTGRLVPPKMVTNSRTMPFVRLFTFIGLYWLMVMAFLSTWKTGGTLALLADFWVTQYREVWIIVPWYGYREASYRIRIDKGCSPNSGYLQVFDEVRVKFFTSLPIRMRCEWKNL